VYRERGGGGKSMCPHPEEGTDVVGRRGSGKNRREWRGDKQREQPVW
jgi:hypothetical protein